MFVATRYATNEKVEFKCLELHSDEEWGSFYEVISMAMKEGHIVV